MDPVAYTHFRLGPEAAEELKRIIQEQNPAALATLRKSLVVLLGPHSVNVEDDGVRLICQGIKCCEVQIMVFWEPLIESLHDFVFLLESSARAN